MRIDIITVLPEMLEGFVNVSILDAHRRKGWWIFTFIIFAITRRTSTAGLMIILSEVLPEW